MNIAYKIIMIIVGCVVAYYIMSLATNSKEFVQGMVVQNAGNQSMSKVSDSIKTLEHDFKAFAEKTTQELDRFKSDEEKQDAYIQTLQGKVTARSNVSNGDENDGDTGYVSISAYKAEKKLDDSREDAIEKKLAQQDELIKKIIADNLTIKNELNAKVAEIQVLKMKEYSELTNNINRLENKTANLEETEVGQLQDIENNYKRLEESINKSVAGTKQWVNDKLESMPSKTNANSTKMLTAEIELLKREIQGLHNKLEQVTNNAKTITSNESVGIVVSKVFDKSLVMINTAEGTFIFNPYANFTGVVRVRDGEGNEQMVLVPYTGDYLRIGENIIDTGPFARSCAQGINCNIDVRGSVNVPVAK